MADNFPSFSSNPEEISAPSQFFEEIPVPLKLFAKSKRILKREHARKRTKAQKTSENDQLFCEDSAVSEKERRKLQQKIRNRMSAQQSRDRKKVYISFLEQQNSQLLQENSLLRQDLQACAAENQLLREELASFRENKEEKLEEVQKSPLVEQFFLEETTNFSNNSGFSSPFLGGSRDALKYSLALLSIVCFLAVFSGSFAQFGDVSTLAQKPAKYAEIPRLSTEKQAFPWNSLPNLELLTRFRGEIMREILKNGENSKKSEEKHAIMAYKARSFQENAGFLAKENETQLVLVAETRDFPVSTLFCPSGYVYEPEVLRIFLEF